MRIDTIIVGAGHAGLAVSRLLTDAGHDHVVLDRGRVAERWRTERWDSLHLLTPNWMTRLPGWRYTGADPDGYLSDLVVKSYAGRVGRDDGISIADQPQEGPALTDDAASLMPGPKSADSSDPPPTTGLA